MPGVMAYGATREIVRHPKVNFPPVSRLGGFQGREDLSAILLMGRKSESLVVQSILAAGKRLNQPRGKRSLKVCKLAVPGGQYQCWLLIQSAIVEDQDLVHFANRTWQIFQARIMSLPSLVRGCGMANRLAACDDAIQILGEFRQRNVAHMNNLSSLPENSSEIVPLP
jgi:hypothetical protein